jgi:hypothetical protein
LVELAEYLLRPLAGFEGLRALATIKVARQTEYEGVDSLLLGDAGEGAQVAVSVAAANGRQRPNRAAVSLGNGQPDAA